MVEYFDQTYVIRVLAAAPVAGAGLQINVQRAAIFPPPVWNVNELTMSGNARTNNNCEAWNLR